MSMAYRSVSPCRFSSSTAAAESRSSAFWNCLHGDLFSIPAARARDSAFSYPCSAMLSQHPASTVINSCSRRFRWSASSSAIFKSFASFVAAGEVFDERTAGWGLEALLLSSDICTWPAGCRWDAATGQNSSSDSLSR